MLVLMVTMEAIWGICLSFVVFRHIRQIDELRSDRDAHETTIASTSRQVQAMRAKDLGLINRPGMNWWDKLQADVDAHNGV